MGAAAVIRAAEFVAPIDDPKLPQYQAQPIRTTARGARRARPNQVKQTAKALVVLALEEATDGSPSAGKKKLRAAAQPSELAEVVTGRERVLCEFKALTDSSTVLREGEHGLSRGVLRAMLAHVCAETGLTEEPLDAVLDAFMEEDSSEVSYDRFLSWLYDDGTLLPPSPSTWATPSNMRTSPELTTLPPGEATDAPVSALEDDYAQVTEGTDVPVSALQDDEVQVTAATDAPVSALQDDVVQVTEVQDGEASAAQLEDVRGDPLLGDADAPQQEFHEGDRSKPAAIDSTAEVATPEGAVIETGETMA